jgi:endonuclease/exonuclease/phosphatase family metal-dependent hydrolase
MVLRVLSWNLFHGRSVPPAGRELFDEFADALARWEWDVALLQEVPPWWPGSLARRAGADHRLVLTSRNSLLALRRAVAVRWPDAAKSNGGGCNAILVRGRRIEAARARRLSWLPERRWVHGVRLDAAGGIWVWNLHTSADAAQCRLAAAVALAWSGGRAPVVLGGDFNVRELALDGWRWAGGHRVDHVFVRNLETVGEARALDHGRMSDHGQLSDHAPVWVEVRVVRPQAS